MKMLTVSLLVCAVMALTRAAAFPEAKLVKKTGPLIPEVKSSVFKWSSPCFSDWTDSSGRCFLYVPTPMTWANAETGTWFWSDGTPFNFNYWAQGQPDGNGNTGCLVMNYGDQKKFDDQPCSRLWPFVCAKKP